MGVGVVRASLQRWPPPPPPPLPPPPQASSRAAAGSPRAACAASGPPVASLRRSRAGAPADLSLARALVAALSATAAEVISGSSSAAAAAAAPPLVAARRPRRRRLQRSAGRDHVARRPQYKALLLDVGGTLLDAARPVHATYAEIGAKYGVTATPTEIKEGLKRVFAQPPGEAQRYEGDGRKFWRHVVELVTGCSDQVYFEELYEYYAQAKAWTVAAGARDSLTLLRDAGVKIAVVSNFDSRLRPLLRELQVYYLLDAVIVSAEVGFDKPSTEIFRIALDELAVAAPNTAVHVGDDPVADYQGSGKRMSCPFETLRTEYCHHLQAPAPSLRATRHCFSSQVRG
eukprot:SM000025S08404  [mRNA]  locus=s25:581098:584122:- [translate_table: standard]